MPLDALVFTTINLSHHLNTEQELSTFKKSPFQNFKIKRELSYLLSIRSSI